ncbi:DUF2975 domain-containing protein [Chryseobacterium oryzae]|uniref:DUF2975 domain-containing protein n=1 Tax=Chryseobacterium oryzae TaxID=2929799 RepID=A0ABY4BEY3_9FLAO|nr:DUF2975 domain-containing protein [Chryseobacterium oryzae]UOE37717.1 DUF2975 domain-containing protein [Chryseobacterium oryzae]
MNNSYNVAISFLKIILWITLVSAVLGIIAIFLFFGTATFNFNFPLFTSANIEIGGNKVTFEELKKTGFFNFAIICFLSILYLWFFIKLSKTALTILNKVNLKSPFSEESANLISKLGNTALTLGILNILISTIIPLLYRGSFSININFENSNFFIIAAILYIVSVIFKKGIELQSENDLTI